MKRIIHYCLAIIIALISVLPLAEVEAKGVASYAITYSTYDLIESIEYKIIPVLNPVTRTVHDVMIQVGRGNNFWLGPFVQITVTAVSAPGAIIGVHFNEIRSTYSWGVGGIGAVQNQHEDIVVYNATLFRTQVIRLNPGWIHLQMHVNPFLIGGTIGRRSVLAVTPAGSTLNPI